MSQVVAGSGSGGGQTVNIQMRSVTSEIVWAKPLKPLNMDSVINIVIHHTGSATDSVKAIHDYHRQKWPSEAGFGYNFYIETSGIIWIGRGFNVGTQTSMHNSSTIGVCLEGNFDNTSPTAAQLTALDQVCAYILKQVSGLKMNPNTITTHQAYCNTNCPGKNMIALISSTRKRVATLIGSNATIQAYAAANSGSLVATDAPIPINNAAFFFYVVKKGDTWESIANILGCTKDTLWKVNEFGQSTALVAGLTVIAPFNAKASATQYVQYAKSFADGLLENIRFSAEQSVRQTLLSGVASTSTVTHISNDGKSNNIRHDIGSTFTPNEYEKFKILIQDGDIDQEITFRIDPTGASESHSQDVKVIRTKGGFMIGTQRNLSQQSISGTFLDMNGVSEKDNVMRAIKNKLDNGRNMIMKVFMENSCQVIEVSNIGISDNPSNPILKSYQFNYFVLKDTRFMTADNVRKNAFGGESAMGQAIKSKGASAGGPATKSSKPTNTTGGKTASSKTKSVAKATTASKAKKNPVGAAKASASKTLAAKGKSPARPITRNLANAMKNAAPKKRG